MTVTKTADVEATLAQIYELAGAEADLVRCTCNDRAAACPSCGRAEIDVFKVAGEAMAAL